MTITCENGLVSGTMSIAASFRADGSSDDKVNVVLDVQLVNVPLQDVVATALRDVRIAFVNNVGRPNFSSWKQGQHISVDFTAPGKKPADHRANMIKAMVSAGVPIEQATMLAEQIAKNPTLLNKVLE